MSGIVSECSETSDAHWGDVDSCFTPIRPSAAVLKKRVRSLPIALGTAPGLVWELGFLTDSSKQSVPRQQSVLRFPLK